jgi:glycopeptide antibiotics resistance protein
VHPAIRVVAWLLLVPYAANVVRLTLTPVPPTYYKHRNVVPFRTIHMYLSGADGLTKAFHNLGGNVVLLLPLGLFLVVATPLPARIVPLVVALVSVAIEVAQYTIVTGRSADVDDVILNTIGGAIGAGLGALATVRPRVRADWRREPDGAEGVTG